MEQSLFSMLYDHPFSNAGQKQLMTVNSSDDIDVLTARNERIEYKPDYNAITYEWETYCRPHFLSVVVESGSGHAIYMDVQWKTRHGRIADILRSMIASSTNDDDLGNFGPHLIITTDEETTRYAEEFHQYNDTSRIFNMDSTVDEKHLYALRYHGLTEDRRQLRKLFSHASGIAKASFHVLIASYDDFLEDYVHFCHLPFDTVVLDDGVAWMGVKEPNSILGLVWSSALFSSNDHFTGLAGTTYREWDFMVDDVPEVTMKEALIGLTARHRIATASSLAITHAQTKDLLPVSNLLEFLMPQFYAHSKEDWDKSKVWNDSFSMDHFRNLLSRLVVVYCDTSSARDVVDLAKDAIFGRLQATNLAESGLVSPIYTDEYFIESGKVHSHSLLRWLGPPYTSRLRHAFGKASFQHILDAMKTSSYFGPLCEVVTTASSLTSAGAMGQVSGVAAFRLAVRCGRHFGSDLGLRQHLFAQHAPCRTWTCRTCSMDCITSQTRTQHEKQCGQPINGA
jgi:hypothetical protein